MIRFILLFLLGVLLPIIPIAKETKGNSPFGELKNSYIPSGFDTSKGGRFIVKSSIAESMVGQSISSDSVFVVSTGYLKPDFDLIFFNGLE